MIARTWPYGTTIEVTVKYVISSGSSQSIICVDAKNEAYVLIGERTTAKPGENRSIIFREGGPTGGYWELLPLNKEK